MIPKDQKSTNSPWFDQQRHRQLRDNLTHEQRKKWQKQTKTLYWNPERATCLNGNRNERLYDLDSKFKDKLTDKVGGFERKHIVSIDTDSLKELSI